MTTPAEPSGQDIVSETIVYHLEDGTPTTNKDKAATAEVTTRYADGTTGHTIMRRD